MVELGALFIAALVAATLVPAQSEALMVALIAAGEHATVLLVAIASLGNVLGSIINWWLGRQVDRFKDRRWFPASPAALARARDRYHRWGRWSLLAAWVPIVGDPLTVVAGIMREPLRTFVPLVAIGKVGRYVLLALGAEGIW